MPIRRRRLRRTGLACCHRGHTGQGNDRLDKPAPAAEVAVHEDETGFSWGAAEKDLMAGIDTSIPHSARIWNYWLGGKDNFPADRAAGEQYLETFPGIIDIARLTRQFLQRAVRYLAGEVGIRQFLDIGTGLPTVD